MGALNLPSIELAYVNAMIAKKKREEKRIAHQQILAAITETGRQRRRDFWLITLIAFAAVVMLRLL